MRRLLIAMLYAGIFVMPSLSHAFPVTVNFTATITHMDDPFGFTSLRPGNLISGSYTFESSTPNSSVDPQVGIYTFNTAPSSFTLYVNNIIIRSNVLNPMMYIRVINRSSDMYLVELNNIPMLPNRWTIESVLLELIDDTGSKLSSTLLPVTPFTLDGWNINSLTITGSDLNYFVVYAQVTSLSTPIQSNAGPDQTLDQLDSPVTLDGSGSIGTDLTYLWSVDSAPAGSTATVSNANMVNPTFTPDKWGNYVLKLTVNDAYNHTSSDSMNISIDSIPVAAVAATPQALTWHNQPVTLDGSQSYDDDGDSLTYAWTLTKPQGSTAVLSDAMAVKPSFVADIFGDYYASLKVTDTAGNSSTAEVKVSFNNLPPVADAGSSQAVPMNTTVYLDGSQSSDPNGDTITYQWSFVSKPQDSQTTFSDADTAKPYFVADWPGTYVVQLIVNDGQVNCDTPATVQIQASVTQDGAVVRLQSLSDSIRAIPSEAFKKNSMQNTLLNKIISVINSIDAGNYQDALGQLQNDIMGKSDGCANSNPFAPDKNDWLITCTAQQQIYGQISDIIKVIQGLM